MKDNLLKQAKVEAARNHISLTAFIEDAVERKLAEGRSRADSVSDFNIITFGGGGTYPGIDLSKSADVLETLGE